jgi:hypothetical protein
MPIAGKQPAAVTGSDAQAPRAASTRQARS